MTEVSEEPVRESARPKRFKLVGWVLAVLGAVLTLGAWSAASPAGSAPDDNFHFATIWCKSVWNTDRCQFDGVAEGAYGQAWYLIPPQAGFPGFQKDSNGAPCFIFNPNKEGVCPDTPPVGRIPINDGLYPPVFYAFAGLFAAEDQGQTAFQVRLGVSLAAIALLAAAYAVSLPWLRPAVILSIAVGLVPMGLSFIASTNPSSWAIAGVMAVWPAAVTVLLARPPRRRIAAAVVLVLAMVMACGARADAAAYVAVILFLLTFVLWQRSTWPARITVIAALLASVFVFLSSGQSSNITEGFLEEEGQRGVADVVWAMVKALPGLWLGNTGAPGGVNNNQSSQLAWFDVPIPPTAWGALLMVIGALILIGWAWMPWQKAITLAGLIGAAVVVPGYAMIMNRVVPGELIQPRYLLPLVLVIFGISLLHSWDQPLRLTVLQAAAIGVAVAVAQALSLHVFMRKFITGVEILSPNLDEGALWWWSSSPLSPNQVLLLGAVGWSLVCLVAVAHTVEPRVRNSLESS